VGDDLRACRAVQRGRTHSCGPILSRFCAGFTMIRADYPMSAKCWSEKAKTLTIHRRLFSSLMSAAVALSALMMPAIAHHSHAMFDMASEVAVSGTVSAVRFRNPHVYLLLEVEDTSGETSRWTVEMSTIGNMIDRGIDANTFSQGDEVTIKVNPLRNGNSGGNYTRVESINGVENTAADDNWAPAD